MKNKRSQLVTEYLEHLSGKAIEEYQSIIKEFIRGKNGIYGLYKDGKLVYVGLAVNLLRRIDHHLRDRHKGEWDSFSVFVVKNNSHLRELESLVMRVAYPKNNKQKGKFANAIDLSSDFKIAARQYFEEIEGSLFVKNNKNQKIKPKKSKYFKALKKDMIVVPAREDGFKKVFLGENCWRAIRLNVDKIDSIKYIAAYQKAPVSAITYLAKVKKIEEYKHTGKYIVYFDGKPRKLHKPIKAKNLTMQSLVYGNREALRTAKTIEDVR